MKSVRMNHQLSKQNNFLLLGSRVSLSTGEFATFDHLIKSVENWESLYQQSVDLNVSSLLYKNLLPSKNRNKIPVEMLEKLKKMYIKTMIRNSKMNADFKVLMQLLKTHTIDFMPLKGMDLNFSVYGDMGLRLMGDIDLLIKKEEIERTKNVMIENGWKLEKIVFRTKVHKELIEGISYHPYVMKKDETIIELHTNIHNTYKPYKVDIKDYWIRSLENYTLMGLKTRRLNKTDLLQHICLHTYNDLRFQKYSLKLFIDITELLKKEINNIDWNLLKNTCEKYNCTDEVKQTLKICATYFNAPVDDKFMNFQPHKIATNVDLEKLFLNVFTRNSYAVLHNWWYRQYILIYKYKGLVGLQSIFIFLKGHIFPSAEFVSYKFTKTKTKKVHFYMYRFLRIIN
jgi:hypothetical protein